MPHISNTIANDNIAIVISFVPLFLSIDSTHFHLGKLNTTEQSKPKSQATQKSSFNKSGNIPIVVGYKSFMNSILVIIFIIYCYSH